VVAEVFLAGRRAEHWVELLNSAGILLLTSITMISLFRLKAGFLAEAASRPLTGEISPEDQALVDRLEQEMKVARAYRQEGLTIGDLANRVGVSEHKLRRVINGSLGYRNFARFVNGYRLDEAKARLADADERLPILSIALEAGFGSIGPFNRAFKEDTGLTPKAYRRGRSERAPDKES
jgi:AraC-like DNA-binding protein